MTRTCLSYCLSPQLVSPEQVSLMWCSPWQPPVSSRRLCLGKPHCPCWATSRPASPHFHFFHADLPIDCRWTLQPNPMCCRWRFFGPMHLRPAAAALPAIGFRAMPACPAFCPVWTAQRMILPPVFYPRSTLPPFQRACSSPQHAPLLRSLPPLVCAPPFCPFRFRRRAHSGRSQLRHHACPMPAAPCHPFGRFRFS